MKFKLVTAAAMAVAALSSGAVNAAQYDLGPITVLKTFAGFAQGPFLDTFKFSVLPNGGTNYEVADFTLVPSQLQTVFTLFQVVSNADGIVGTGDDSVVASASSISGTGLLTLSLGGTAGGNYYLSVSGITSGSVGGIYNGAISVSPVPEPETYAMMLAGLAALGFLARRRQG